MSKVQDLSIQKQFVGERPKPHDRVCVVFPNFHYTQSITLRKKGLFKSEKIELKKVKTF